MSECSFCHRSYEIPKGLTYVLASGDILHFCSGKCKKNYDLGRKSKKVSWVRKKTKEEKLQSVDK